MVKKILYIGLEFHLKTRSSQFFIDILKKYYEIDFIWCGQFEASLDIMNSRLIHNDYTAVILFQIMLTKEKLELLNCQNIILIPMYDNDLNITYGKWRQFSQYKFIHFSKTLFDKLNFLGVTNSVYLQYAPKPDQSIKNIQSGKKAKLFFWQRANALNLEYIKKLIDPSQIESIHLHRLSADAQNDPFFQEPNQADVKKYNITYTSWFDNKEDIEKIMQASDIFIAPRLYEGIGQAFLEAMSYGKCVISPNHPTMNEYIINGYNGILFDYHNPQLLDISNFRLLGENAKKTILDIHNEFIAQESKIIDFIVQKSIHVNDSNTLAKNISDLQKELSSKNMFILEDLKMGYYNDKLSMLFAKYLNLLYAKLQKMENEFVLYGAGHGATLLLAFDSTKCKYIIDNDITKHNKQIGDKIIYPLERLKNEKFPQVVVVSVLGRAANIIENLQQDELLKKHSFISLDVDPFYGEVIE